MATAALERVQRPLSDGPSDHRPDAVWAPAGTGRTTWVAAVVPALLMLVVGLVGLDRQSVWRDEAASLVAARRSLPDLWAMLQHTDSVHALYYLALHAWLQLGDGEAWARVPSVLALAGAAGLVGAIGARLTSTRVGLLAGLLLVANPAASYYAQEIRSSAVVAATALLCTWLLLQALERDRRWWIAYALAAVVLVGLNVLAMLVLLALAVTLRWWRLPRRVLACWAVATVPAALLGAALVVVTAAQPYQIGWIPRPGLGSFRDLAHLLLGPGHAQALVGVVLLLAGVWLARAPYERRLRALAVPLLVLPAAVLIAVSLAQPVFVARYVFPSVAAAAWTAALGVDGLAAVVARRCARRRHRLAAALLSAALVLGLGLLGLSAQRLDRTPASRPDDLAGAAASITARAQPGDAVLFVPDNRRLVALAYPAAFADLHDLGLAASPAVARNLTGRTRPLPAVLADLAGTDRVWAVGRPGLALLPGETDSATELGVLDRDFSAVERTGADGVGATLFVRHPHPA